MSLPWFDDRHGELTEAFTAAQLQPASDPDSWPNTHQDDWCGEFQGPRHD